MMITPAFITQALAGYNRVAAQSPAASPPAGSTITTADGVQLYYKDWGPRTGQPIVSSHGWPLSSDSWESQMIFLASQGYRVIAHDRRGHGRSSQPWDGNDMDHVTDDLAAVIETLQLKKAVLVGFSSGGGEVARYIGRHSGHGPVRQEPQWRADCRLQRPPRRPVGQPRSAYKDIPAGPFFGFNRPGAKVSQGLIDHWWLKGMLAGHKNSFDSI